MALYDNYFTNEDKPFAENLNDALLLSNVFDMTVDVEAPLMFSNSTWVNTTSPRKCSVSILTLKDGLPSGVSVGTDSSTGNSTLTGTGTVSLSWYPNFNSFGKFKAISWENDGTIVVNLKTTNGTTIASNIHKGNIENQSSDLRTLQEIVIELVFTNATLYNLSVTMENKQQDRYGATVGITDVTGLDDTITAIQSKNTQQDERLSTLEGVDDGVFFYQVYANDYSPNIDGTVTVYCKCTDIGGVGVEDKSLTLYKDDTPVGTQTTNSNGVASWNVSFSDWNNHLFRCGNANLSLKAKGYKTYSLTNGTLYYDDEKAMAVLNYHSTATWNVSDWTPLGIVFANVPNGLRPSQNVFAITRDNRLIVRVKTDGNWEYTTGGNNINAPYLYTTLTWFLP